MANEQTSDSKSLPIEYSGWFGHSYENPWATWKPPSKLDKIKWIFMQHSNQDLKNVEEDLPVILSKNNESYWKDFQDPKLPGIRFIWIGHASCLVQMDGVTFLTDPVFSERFTLVKGDPKRYRPLPFEIEDIPDGLINAVIISHNHYDHLDKTSVQKLQAKNGNIQWLVPKSLKSWFTKLGIPPGNVKDHMWWENSVIGDVEFHFTPAQHWSFRNYVLDYNKSLWGSWSVKGKCGMKFFFSGDTGYCKAFKEIGDEFGEFDLAAIPIGAYKPRELMKGQHVDPEEAIQIHKDVKSKRSIGIHWGTLRIGYEEYMEPKTELAEQMKKAKLDPKEFDTVYHGKILTIFKNENDQYTENIQNDQNRENSENDQCTKSIQECTLSESSSLGSDHQETNAEN